MPNKNNNNNNNKNNNNNMIDGQFSPNMSLFSTPIHGIENLMGVWDF